MLAVSRRILGLGYNVSYLSICRNSSDSTVAILVHVNRRIQISALNHVGRNRELKIVEGARRKWNNSILDQSRVLEERDLIALRGAILITKSESVHWQVINRLIICWGGYRRISNLLNPIISISIVRIIVGNINDLVGSIDWNSGSINSGSLNRTQLGWRKIMSIYCQVS